MGEKSNTIWKVTTVICAVLLVGAAVAIVLLAVNQGNKVDKKSSEEQIQALEDQIAVLEGEVNSLEGELAQAKATQATTGSNTSGSTSNNGSTSSTSDRDQLEALGEQFAGDNFHVGEIVIDGNWARVGIAPNEPAKYQGELCYYHKVNGQWTLVDYGTGLQYGDVPGAPASIFP
jgi:TolA-binding protein